MKKLAVANGSYQKDGQQKTRWVNVGIVNTTADGKEYMLIDPTINFAAFPREEGKDMVMVGMFEEQNQGQPQQGGGYQQSNNNQQQQQYQPTQEYKNAQGQLTDASGKVMLDQNGNPRYS